MNNMFQAYEERQLLNHEMRHDHSHRRSALNTKQNIIDRGISHPISGCYRKKSTSKVDSEWMYTGRKRNEYNSNQHTEYSLTVQKHIVNHLDSTKMTT